MADRKSRKEQITALRSQQILNAAGDIFSQKGYSAATIPEIARAAGLAPGTLYLYFPNKRELFLKVIENFLVKPLVNIFEQQSSLDFSSVMQAALENRLEFFESEVFGRTILLMNEILRDPELKENFYKSIVRPLFERVGSVYAAQKTSGAFRQIDPQVVVRLVGGMMIGMAIVRNLEGSASPLNKYPRERLVKEILDFILHGVAVQEQNKA